MQNFHLEICVETLQSAINAERGGANRLELCSALGLGGLTPTLGFVHGVKQKVQIPIIPLIRLRPGNFIYSDDEISIMLKDIQDFIKMGVNGIAIGALTVEGEIDMKACKILMEPALSKKVPVTFHRAFDYTKDPMTALESVIKLGCSNLLTSGGKVDALVGATVINNLIKKAQGKVNIIPAGGLSPSNVADIIKISGAHEVHGSASVQNIAAVAVDSVKLGHSDAFSVRLCSIDIVRQIKKVADSV